MAEVFKQVYGYVPARVPGLPNYSEEASLNTIQPLIKKDSNLYGQPLYGKADLIGREVFCPVNIEGVDKFGTAKDFHLPYSVIGIDRTKTVIMTEMTELSGSVKEVIGNRDYEITIKGFLLGEYEQFPDKELSELNELFEQNRPVRLKSAFSDIFLYNHDTVLITRLSIPQKPGVVGVRDFSLQMVSDSIFNLYEK